MVNPDESRWASRDDARIALADLFHDWRTTWDELQQQRTGGPGAHRDLSDRLVDLEARIVAALRAAPPPP